MYELSNDQLPSTNAVSKRLHGLEATNRVALYLEGNEAIGQGFDRETIAQAYQELIDAFNDIDVDDPMTQYMPGVIVLKEKLQGEPLPDISEIRPRDFYFGLQEAVPLMMLGQNIKRGEIEPTSEERKQAIGTPSMDTGARALVTGVIGHLLERSIFAYMRRIGVAQDWEKDEVLLALEEIGLLLKVREMEESPLNAYTYWLVETYLQQNFNHQEYGEEYGGLGWRKPEHVAKLATAYKTENNIDLFPLEWGDPVNYLPRLAPDLFERMDDAMINTLYGLSHYAIRMVRFAIQSWQGEPTEDDYIDPRTGQVVTLEMLGIKRKDCIGDTTSTIGRERQVAEVTIALYRLWENSLS